MLENLTSAQKSDSSVNFDSKTEMSESGASENEFSQLPSPTPFQREFGMRSTEKDFEKQEKSRKRRFPHQNH